jgi:hypothetical protein
MTNSHFPFLPFMAKFPTPDWSKNALKMMFSAHKHAIFVNLEQTFVCIRPSNLIQNLKFKFRLSGSNPEIISIKFEIRPSLIPVAQ